MITPLFDTCTLCGRKTRKPGDRLCTFHDIQYLIAQGPKRMKERLRQQRKNVPPNRMKTTC